MWWRRCWEIWGGGETKRNGNAVRGGAGEQKEGWEGTAGREEEGKKDFELVCMSM